MAENGANGRKRNGGATEGDETKPKRKREDLSHLTPQEKLDRFNRMNNERVKKWRIREAEKKAEREAAEREPQTKEEKCARCKKEEEREAAAKEKKCSRCKEPCLTARKVEVPDDGPRPELDDGVGPQTTAERFVLHVLHIYQ